MLPGHGVERFISLPFPLVVIEPGSMISSYKFLEHHFLEIFLLSKSIANIHDSDKSMLKAGHIEMSQSKR